jgi:diadenosine tetraphosphatase ApaH/serine/threonine PP2A family protein phosphatase
MTIYYVISDIHANMQALESVLDDIERDRTHNLTDSLLDSVIDQNQSPDSIPPQPSSQNPSDVLICLGDFVGYGPHPNEAIELFRDAEGFGEKIAIFGNNDHALLDLYDGVFNSHRTPGWARQALLKLKFRRPVNDTYRILEWASQALLKLKSRRPVNDTYRILEWTSTVITEENIDFLRRQKGHYRPTGLYFAHADPTNPTLLNYVLPGSDVIKKYFDPPYLVPKLKAFVGHAHVPQVYTLMSQGIIELDFYQTSQLPNRSLIVVGSVGQPRNGTNQASWCRYDNSTHELSFHFTDYDIGQTQKDMRDINSASKSGDIFDSNSIERLSYGW